MQVMASLIHTRENFAYFQRLKVGEKFLVESIENYNLEQKLPNFGGK